MIPQTHNDYKAMVKDQWEYGYSRMTEALSKETNDKNHVRNANTKNASAKLLKQLN